MAALLVLLAAACSSIQVHSHTASGVDPASYASFAQVPPPEKGPESLPGYDAAVAARIQQEIAAVLVAKGYAVAPPDTADLLVAFSVDGKPRSDQQLTDVYVGGGYGWQGAESTVDYVEGELVIDLYEAKRRQIVWHGVGSVDLFPGSSDPELPNRVVRAILDDLPAR